MCDVFVLCVLCCVCRYSCVWLQHVGGLLVCCVCLVVIVLCDVFVWVFVFVFFFVSCCCCGVLCWCVFDVCLMLCVM